MKHPIRSALCAIPFIAASGVAQAVAVSGQGTWETTLHGRDLDGNLATFEAYYDSTLDITWLADANYAQTSGFDDNGFMNWNDANAWAAGLNLGGITGWRLPTMMGTDCSTVEEGPGDACGFEPGPDTSEMATMHYTTLGNGTDETGMALTNTGPFANIRSSYWTDTTGSGSTDEAWYFLFRNGYQRSNTHKSMDLAAWAVHAGDVSAVPVPAAAWLFGSGMIGLLGVMRRQR